MLKYYLVRKMPLVVGTWWLYRHREVIVDRILVFLTQKVFYAIGSRFPRLEFLKMAGR